MNSETNGASKTTNKVIIRSAVSLTAVVLIVLALSSFSGCVTIPDGVKPVDNFDVDKYAGKWYEIARLDHSFERGLSKVSAEYEIQKDGSVSVLNKGYSAKKKKWKEAKGRALFVEEKTKGFLKVSFFGPFYGSYVVFGLDPDYKYSYVCGPDKSYLWFLARTPTVDDEVRDAFVKKAKGLGFDTDKLIFVEQDEEKVK